MEKADTMAYSQTLKLLPDFKVTARVQLLAEVQDYNIRMMNIPAMWRRTQGEGVKLVVLDSGLPVHVDLKPTGSKSFIPGYLEDKCGHSTFCGGITAAIGGNGIGVIGIAPQLEDYYGAVLDGAGSGSINAIIEGIRWAVDIVGAQVISMSLGIEAGAPHFAALEEACNYAVAQGCTVFVASGNEGGKVGQPACYDSVLAVAAVGSAKQHASFSNMGAEVDFAAGGVDVYSTYLNNGYCKMSGTSMATPALAAVGALIISDHLKRGEILTPADVRAHLKRIAYDVGEAGFDELYGNGIPIFSNNPDDPIGEPVITPVCPPNTAPEPSKWLVKKAGLPEADCVYWRATQGFVNDMVTSLEANINTRDALLQVFKKTKDQLVAIEKLSEKSKK